MYYIKTGIERAEFKTRKAAQDYIDEIDPHGLFALSIHKVNYDMTPARGTSAKCIADTNVRLAKYETV